MFSEYCSISTLTCSFEFVWVMGGIPSSYLVSTQLQFWLFCCWGWGCCWDVTIIEYQPTHKVHLQLFSLYHLFIYIDISGPRWPTQLKTGDSGTQAYLLLAVMLDVKYKLVCVQVDDWTIWDYNHLLLNQMIDTLIVDEFFWQTIGHID